MSKIIFAGTPDFAAVHLKALIDAGIVPCAVYTQPDRPAGRGHKLTPSPVKELALACGIEVLTPENFKNQADVEKFLSFNADLAIVVAYGVILPEAIVHGPRLGCINVHGSLLPAYRGAAPIQRALIDGCSHTGVTIMKIVKELDAGDMLVKAQIPISNEDTSGSLFNKLATLGAKTLVDNLQAILNEKIEPQPQDPSLVTYAKKITKAEARLDFNDSARNCDLKIRGLNPWPIANASINNTVFKIFKAKVIDENHSKAPGTVIAVNKNGITVACADGAICLEVIQAPGKGRVNAADFARSRSDIFSVGKKFD